MNKPRMRPLLAALLTTSVVCLCLLLAIFGGLPAASNAQSLLSKDLATHTNSSHDASSVFYTTSGAGFGFPNGAEIVAIDVTGRHVSFKDIGPTFGGDCGSLALSPRGTLYSMCGPTFGAQQLATINRNTGRATLFGMPVPGLAVMAIAFGPNGVLYAVGDCNPDPTTFECRPGSDPHYNSLYTVNITTGAFARVGATGAPQFFMDLTFDRDGHMLGVTSTVNPSALPAILYRLDKATGKATRLVNLVGSTSAMGLAFGRDGQLYATDNAQNPGLYLIDTKTGFETAIATVPFAFSSGLELVNPD
jgi:DNA-binding beta-propeller fold protein YncE